MGYRSKAGTPEVVKMVIVYLCLMVSVQYLDQLLYTAYPSPSSASCNMTYIMC